MNFLKEHMVEIKEQWRIGLKTTYPEKYKDSLQEQLVEHALDKAVEIIEKYCETRDLQTFITKLVDLTKSAHQLMQLVELFETSTYDVLLKKKQKTPEEMLEILQGIREIKQRIYFSVVKQYEDNYESTIKIQKEALQELSTPVMPVFERVIVVPIVGTLDAERSKQMLENVLNAVVKNKSEIVLLDITGVPFVDSMVAYHLIQVVNAIHIVGGKSMLVGIKPEIAQILVKLGVDLSNIVTLGTLQEGLEKALVYTNKFISEVKEV